MPRGVFLSQKGTSFMKRFLTVLAFVFLLTACGGTDLEQSALKVIGKTPGEAIKITNGTEQDDAIIIDTQWADRDVQGVYTISDTFEPFRYLDEGILNALRERGNVTSPIMKLAVEEPNFSIPLQQAYITQYDANFEQMSDEQAVIDRIQEAYTSSEHIIVQDTFNNPIHFFETDDFLIIYEGQAIHYVPHYTLFEAMKK